MTGTSPHPDPNKGGPEKMQKNCKKRDPEHFDLIRGELRVFSCLAGGQGVLGPFLWGLYPLCLPSICIMFLIHDKLMW